MIVPFFSLDAPEMSDRTGRPGITHDCGCCYCRFRKHNTEFDDDDQICKTTLFFLRGKIH